MYGWFSPKALSLSLSVPDRVDKHYLDACSWILILTPTPASFFFTLSASVTTNICISFLQRFTLFWIILYLKVKENPFWLFQNFCLPFCWIFVVLHWEKTFLTALCVVAHLVLIFLNIEPEKLSSVCLYGLVFKTTKQHLSIDTEEGFPNLCLTNPDYPNTYHWDRSLKTVILIKCCQRYFIWVIIGLFYLLTSKLHHQQF